MANWPCATAGDLITALANAVGGDTITLTATNFFDTTSGFTLRNHGGTTPIVVRSSLYANFKAGQRVCPGDLAQMPLLRATAQAPVINGLFGAGYWTLIGLAITTTVDSNTTALVIMAATVTYDPTLESQLPHHIIIDRCLVYGKAGVIAVGGTSRGFEFNATDSQITNCYIHDFRRDGQDNQAIWIRTARRLLVQNNYLEAAGENFFIGGAGFFIEDHVPSDIMVRGNHFAKRREWNWWDPDYFGTTPGSCVESAGPGTITCTGTACTTSAPHNLGDKRFHVKLANGEHRQVLTTLTATDLTLASPFTSDPVAATWTMQRGWTVKNLFEVKNGERVTVEDNMMERNWPPDQNGRAVLWSLRDNGERCPWLYIRDCAFRYNWVKNAPNAFMHTDMDPAGFGRTNRTVREVGPGTVTTVGTAATFSLPHGLAVGDVVRIAGGPAPPVGPLGFGRHVSAIVDATHATMATTYRTASEGGGVAVDVTAVAWERWPVTSTVPNYGLIVEHNVWENIGQGEGNLYSDLATVTVGTFYAPQTTGISAPGAAVFDAVHGQPGPNQVTIRHNTVSATDPSLLAPVYFGDATDLTDTHTFKDNIVNFGDSNGPTWLGPFTASGASGSNAATTLAAHTTNSVYTSNLFYGTGANATAAGAGNFFETNLANVGWDNQAAGRFELTSGTYRAGQANDASDGTDMGANVRVVRARVFGRHGLGQGW